jgi:serine/threonine protein kinase
MQPPLTIQDPNSGADGLVGAGYGSLDAARRAASSASLGTTPVVSPTPRNPSRLAKQGSKRTSEKDARITFETLTTQLLKAGCASTLPASSSLAAAEGASSGAGGTSVVKESDILLTSEGSDGGPTSSDEGTEGGVGEILEVFEAQDDADAVTEVTDLPSFQEVREQRQASAEAILSRLKPLVIPPSALVLDVNKSSGAGGKRDSAHSGVAGARESPVPGTPLSPFVVSTPTLLPYPALGNAAADTSSSAHSSNTIRPIGKGAYSLVFRASMGLSQKPVAVKVLLLKPYRELGQEMVGRKKKHNPSKSVLDTATAGSSHDDVDDPPAPTALATHDSGVPKRKGLSKKKQQQARAAAVRRLWARSRYLALQALSSEAVVQSSVSHPNLLRAMGVITRPVLGLVTEYCSRGSLADLLLVKNSPRLHGHHHNHHHHTGGGGSSSRYYVREDPRMTWQLLVQMALEAASGLSYLHSLGITHNDISARNCLVNDSSEVKLGDFGLAMATSMDAAAKPTNGHSRHHHNLAGPLPWMAPEAVVDPSSSSSSTDTSSSIDRSKCDVFSFGCALYELVTGKEPWDDWRRETAGAGANKEEDEIEKKDVECFLRVQRGERVPVVAAPLPAHQPHHPHHSHTHHHNQHQHLVTPSIPCDLIDLVNWCQSHSPSDRPTMQEVVECLEEWLHHYSSAVIPRARLQGQVGGGDANSLAFSKTEKLSALAEGDDDGEEDVVVVPLHHPLSWTGDWENEESVLSVLFQQQPPKPQDHAASPAPAASAATAAPAVPVSAPQSSKQQQQHSQGGRLVGVPASADDALLDTLLGATTATTLVTTTTTVMASSKPAAAVNPSVSQHGHVISTSSMTTTTSSSSSYTRYSRVFDAAAGAAMAQSATPTAAAVAMPTAAAAPGPVSKPATAAASSSPPPLHDSHDPQDSISNPNPNPVLAVVPQQQQQQQQLKKSPVTTTTVAPPPLNHPSLAPSSLSSHQGTEPLPPRLPPWLTSSPSAMSLGGSSEAGPGLPLSRQTSTYSTGSGGENSQRSGGADSTHHHHHSSRHHSHHSSHHHNHRRHHKQHESSRLASGGSASGGDNRQRSAFEPDDNHHNNAPAISGKKKANNNAHDEEEEDDASQQDPKATTTTTTSAGGGGGGLFSMLLGGLSTLGRAAVMASSLLTSGPINAPPEEEEEDVDGAEAEGGQGRKGGSRGEATNDAAGEAEDEQHSQRRRKISDATSASTRSRSRSIDRASIRSGRSSNNNNRYYGGSPRLNPMDAGHHFMIEEEREKEILRAKVRSARRQAAELERKQLQQQQQLKKGSSSSSPAASGRGLATDSPSLLPPSPILADASLDSAVAEAAGVLVTTLSSFASLSMSLSSDSLQLQPQQQHQQNYHGSSNITTTSSKDQEELPASVPAATLGGSSRHRPRITPAGLRASRNNILLRPKPSFSQAFIGLRTDSSSSSNGFSDANNTMAPATTGSAPPLQAVQQQHQQQQHRLPAFPSRNGRRLELPPPPLNGSPTPRLAGRSSASLFDSWFLNENGEEEEEGRGDGTASRSRHRASGSSSNLNRPPSSSTTTSAHRRSRHRRQNGSASSNSSGNSAFKTGGGQTSAAGTARQQRLPSWIDDGDGEEADGEEDNGVDEGEGEEVSISDSGSTDEDLSQDDGEGRRRQRQEEEEEPGPEDSFYSLRGSSMGDTSHVATTTAAARLGAGKDEGESGIAAAAMSSTGLRRWGAATSTNFSLPPSSQPSQASCRTLATSAVVAAPAADPAPPQKTNSAGPGHDATAAGGGAEDLLEELLG